MIAGARMMRMILPAVLAAALAAAPACAQAADATWVQFADPTENAFALEVPQGWTVKGGVKRFSSVVATLWVTAASPDGATQVFIGDPAITPFMIPKNGQAEGTALPSFNAAVACSPSILRTPIARLARAFPAKSPAVTAITAWTRIPSY